MCVRGFGDAARVHEAREILCLSFLFATTDAAKAPLDGTAYGLACGVAAADTGCFSCARRGDVRCVGRAGALGAMTRSHLYALVPSAPVVL